MGTLTGLRLPIEWGAFGFPEFPELGGLVLSTGDVAWSWSGEAPNLPIAAFEPPVGEPQPEEWGIDHVVVMVEDLDRVLAAFAAVDLAPRLRATFRDREMAFIRAGSVIELIESPVRDVALYGVALVTSEPLEVVALRWRARGHDVTDPKPAIQPGRRIMSVRGVDSGLAVMSPDRAV